MLKEAIRTVIRNSSRSKGFIKNSRTNYSPNNMHKRLRQAVERT